LRECVREGGEVAILAESSLHIHVLFHQPFKLCSFQAVGPRVGMLRQCRLLACGGNADCWHAEAMQTVGMRRQCRLLACGGNADCWHAEAMQTVGMRRQCRPTQPHPTLGAVDNKPTQHSSYDSGLSHAALPATSSPCLCHVLLCRRTCPVRRRSRP
jgi:hypothetical protein